jgi:hypothetical protein
MNNEWIFLLLDVFTRDKTMAIAMGISFLIFRKYHQLPILDGEPFDPSNNLK